MICGSYEVAVWERGTRNNSFLIIKSHLSSFAGCFTLKFLVPDRYVVQAVLTLHLGRAGP